MKTQGEIEAAISEGMVRFEQEYMGRGKSHSSLHYFLTVLREYCYPDKNGIILRRKGLRSDQRPAADGQQFKSINATIA
jgi:hypothetical protein